MNAQITTFEEFLDAALAYVGARRDDPERPEDLRPAFISGETSEQALRRWWGEVMLLEIPQPGTFEWTCGGCSARQRTEAPLYREEMSLYVMWGHCSECSQALAEETQPA